MAVEPPMKVLLIEDNPADADLIWEAIEEANAPAGPRAPAFELVHADCLASGLERLATGDIGVVLLDLLLPDSQGLETLARLRMRSPNVPIVVMSGLEDQELALHAVREGAQDYFVKGQLEHGVLPRALRYAMERQRALEERTRLIQEQAARADAEAAAERLRRLQAVTDAALTHLDVDDLLNALLGRITELLAVDTAAVLLLEGDQLVVRAARGLEEDIARGARIPLAGGFFAERIAAERRPITVDNVEQAEVRPFLRDKGVQSLLGAPLLVEERVLGVLHVGTLSPRHFGEEEAELLQLVADRAALALERARLYGTLAERERQLQDLVGRLILAQEEERRRVAYNLHDGLAQTAAGAHLHLRAFARRHQATMPAEKEELDRAVELAQRVVREARTVVAELRPTALDDLGLEAALQAEVEELQKEGWQVEFQVEIGPERLEPAIETALFRVAQEALHNARKHAGADRARVAVRRAERAVRLEVQDWGRGFDPAAIPDGAGPGERVGLSGMRERVALLGGGCEVRSRPGAGTRIVAEVPLRTPAQQAGAAPPPLPLRIPHPA